MRKLTSIESHYWIDSFPVDLAFGIGTGLLACLGGAPTVYHLTMRYLRHHHVLDSAQHQSAAIFLTVLLTPFVFVAVLGLVLVGRLMLRMYRDPL